MGVYRRNFRATLELAPKILRGPLAAAIRAKIPPAEGKDPVDQSFKEIFDFRLHTICPVSSVSHRKPPPDGKRLPHRRYAGHFAAVKGEECPSMGIYRRSLPGTLWERAGRVQAGRTDPAVQSFPLLFAE
jgi:hypothetical protein